MELPLERSGTFVRAERVAARRLLSHSRTDCRPCAGSELRRRRRELPRPSPGVAAAAAIMVSVTEAGDAERGSSRGRGRFGPLDRAEVQAPG